jgi:hypothetical protein
MKDDEANTACAGTPIDGRFRTAPDSLAGGDAAQRATDPRVGEGAACQAEPEPPEPFGASVAIWLRGLAFRVRHGLMGHRTYCFHHRIRGGRAREVELTCWRCETDLRLRK